VTGRRAVGSAGSRAHSCGLQRCLQLPDELLAPLGVKIEIRDDRPGSPARLPVAEAAPDRLVELFHRQTASDTYASPGAGGEAAGKLSAFPGGLDAVG
jgi:hypothetical protein